MKLSLLTVLLLSSLLCFIGAATETPDLAGTYTAHGVGVGGKEYESTVTITKNDQTYLIHWKFADGGFDGVGIVDGESFCVGWSNGNKAGVVSYKIHGDHLEGHWTDGSSNGKVYTENLAKKP